LRVLCLPNLIVTTQDLPSLRSLVLSLPPPPPTSPPFPYTTLFRSSPGPGGNPYGSGRHQVPPGPAPSHAPGQTDALQRLCRQWLDRKSTRLNSSHGSISYAVFCLKKKITNMTTCLPFSAVN